MSRIFLIHATPVAIDPVASAFQSEWPEAEVCNLLDDSLSADLDRTSASDPVMIARFRTLAGYAVGCGCDGILFTCSAFGEAIEAVAEDLKSIPVLKPNEAMFDEAITAGKKIGLLGTFEPSMPSMQREFEAVRSAKGNKVELLSVCVSKAMAALREGDGQTHNRLLAEAAQQFADCDALMLAHFSTSQARDAVADRLPIPILTSPGSAVRQLKRMIG